MPAALALVDREDPITLDEALSEERNIINLHSYGPATKSLYLELWKQRSSIEAIVKHHLALGEQDTCEVLSPRNWIQGNFNVCVFVKVDSCSSSRTVIFRCPMPHKLAEARYPGSINEKSSCEVGAYIWVEENCPEIRAPHLFGFGFSDGRDVCLPFRYSSNINANYVVYPYRTRAILPSHRPKALAHRL